MLCRVVTRPSFSLVGPRIRIAKTMSTRASELVANIRSVESKIDAAAADTSTDKPVLLVAVSKLKPASDIRALYDAGYRHFGENYIQELLEKAAELPADICWHFIGGLQSNKCKKLAASVPNLFAVETVDSVKKADELNKGRLSCQERLFKTKIYLQVNTSGEAEKSGLAGDDDTLNALAEHVRDTCETLELAGVMTIGALANSESSGEANQDFEKLKAAKARLDAKFGTDLKLSMGMSQDFEAAIKQGSDEVRVGTGIFGARPPKKSEAVEEKTAEANK